MPFDALSLFSTSQPPGDVSDCSSPTLTAALFDGQPVCRDSTVLMCTNGGRHRLTPIINKRQRRGSSIMEDDSHSPMCRTSVQLLCEKETCAPSAATGRRLQTITLVTLRSTSPPSTGTSTSSMPSSTLTTHSNAQIDKSTPPPPPPATLHPPPTTSSTPLQEEERRGVHIAANEAHPSLKPSAAPTPQFDPPATTDGHMLQVRAHNSPWTRLVCRVTVSRHKRCCRMS
ncbi:hypothetical protein Q8A73_023353 [Channa argus]|nr:hypothetical protein Q8A73_023353 [Channa argus]